MLYLLDPITVEPRGPDRLGSLRYRIGPLEQRDLRVAGDIFDAEEHPCGGGARPYDGDPLR
jgi:hypothetical protein